MPSKEAHEHAAIENQKTIDHLCVRIDEFPQWIATIAFYKALHIVEAVFDGDQHGPVDHTDDHKYRNRVLKTNNRYSHLWKFYRPLFNISLIARYLREDANSPTYEIFSKYMPGDEVKKTILGHYLAQVERTARTLLGDPNFLSTIKDTDANHSEEEVPS